MPGLIAEEMGLVGVVEDDTVLAAVKQAIQENPDAVSDYFEGKSKALNFLVGQVMRITRGKADPGRTNQMVQEELKCTEMMIIAKKFIKFRWNGYRWGFKTLWPKESWTC